MLRLAFRIFVLLSILPFGAAGVGHVAAQDASTTPDVVGSTYTSPTFGYSLTWDDSWVVKLDQSNTGGDVLGLFNGVGAALFIAQPGFGGLPHPCLAGYARSLAEDANNHDFAPLLDAAGKPIHGEDATRAFASYSYTYTSSDGNSLDLIDDIECRTLVPGASVLIIDAGSPRDAYAGQTPLVQNLLANLAIPSAGEAGPVFVAGSWRVAVVAAERQDAIAPAGLAAKTGKDWLVVVADVTDWSDADATIKVRSFGLRLAGTAKPRGLAASSTGTAAAKLATASTDAHGGLVFTAGQTQRVTLVFQIPHAGADPALTLASEALPLAGVLAVAATLSALPPVTGPPPLQEATVTTIGDGQTLKVVRTADATRLTIHLLNVDAPRKQDCDAKQATRKLTALAGTTVYLEQDGKSGSGTTVVRDVWARQADGTRVLLNQQLVAGGFVAVTGTSTTGRFLSWLQASQAVAQAKPAGLWADCTGPHGTKTPPTADEVAYLTKLALQPVGSLKMSLDLYDTLMQNPQPGDNLWLNRLAFVFQYWAIVGTDTQKQTPPPARYAALGSAYLAAIAPLVAAEQQMTTVEDYLSGKSDRIDMSGLDLDALAIAVAQARTGLDQYNQLLDAARKEAGLPSLASGQTT